VATGTGTPTRSRRVSEAARTTWEQDALTSCCPPARVSPRSRKKLPTEASKVEPPSGTRLAWPGGSLTGRVPALHHTPAPLMASEAESRARRTGKTYSDTTTLPTRTWEPCAALPQVPTGTRGSEPACGHPRAWGRASVVVRGGNKPTTWRREAVGSTRTDVN
jgi:hypothetical protein